jgi:predicted kinase
MEAVIFSGIQASGKTTFYRERFFETHIRISLDMLKHRSRENVLLQACLAAQQPFVIDNTNLTAAHRARYAKAAHAAGFRAILYFFETDTRSAVARNASRAQAQRVANVAIFTGKKRLEPPTADEPFEEIHVVRIVDGKFVVQPLSK